MADAAPRHRIQQSAADAALDELSDMDRSSDLGVSPAKENTSHGGRGGNHGNNGNNGGENGGRRHKSRNRTSTSSSSSQGSSSGGGKGGQPEISKFRQQMKQNMDAAGRGLEQRPATSGASGGSVGALNQGRLNLRPGVTAMDLAAAGQVTMGQHPMVPLGGAGPGRRDPHQMSALTPPQQPHQGPAALAVRWFSNLRLMGQNGQNVPNGQQGHGLNSSDVPWVHRPKSQNQRPPRGAGRDTRHKGQSTLSFLRPGCPLASTRLKYEI